MKKITILITGAAGNVGNALAEKNKVNYCSIFVY
jgi:nucleoside-diphosphate-sugar epimerase